MAMFLFFFIKPYQNKRHTNGHAQRGRASTGCVLRVNVRGQCSNAARVSLQPLDWLGLLGLDGTRRAPWSGAVGANSHQMRITQTAESRQGRCQHKHWTWVEAQSAGDCVRVRVRVRVCVCVCVCLPVCLWSFIWTHSVINLCILEDIDDAHSQKPPVIFIFSFWNCGRRKHRPINLVPGFIIIYHVHIHIEYKSNSVNHFYQWKHVWILFLCN